MKRCFSLLPIAVSVLALTGCVEDKPAPQLTSPDRNERIEAVRNAQNHYGARPAVSVSAPIETVPSTQNQYATRPAVNVSMPAEVVRFADGQYFWSTNLATDQLPQIEIQRPIVGRWNLPWRPWAYNQ